MRENTAEEDVEAKKAGMLYTDIFSFGVKFDDGTWRYGGPPTHFGKPGFLLRVESFYPCTQYKMPPVVVPKSKPAPF